MKVTTKTGDKGTTSLHNGERRPKSDPVFAVLGDIDELNSWLGMVRASLSKAALSENGRAESGFSKNERTEAEWAATGYSKTGVEAARREEQKRQEWQERLRSIQQTLIDLGCQIATPRHSDMYNQCRKIGAGEIEFLEKQSAALLDSGGVSDQFVLPGANEPSAVTHIARSVCRRAERSLITYTERAEAEHLSSCVVFLNRLSDFLFILAQSCV